MSSASRAPDSQAVFDIARRHSAGTLTLQLRGELDLRSAPRLERALSGALSGSQQRLVLDMTRVSFMDSCGLRAVLRAQRECKQRGCSLSVLAGDQAIRLFELTGVRDSLPLGEVPQIDKAD